MTWTTELPIGTNKTFNKERAIAGDPVQFRDGTSPYDFVWHEKCQLFVGSLNDSRNIFIAWQSDGKYFKNGRMPEFDLFMAKK